MTMMFDFDQLSAVPVTTLPVMEVANPEFNAVRPYRQVQCGTDPMTVERVARAIWDADRLNGDMNTWRSASEGHREDYRNMARGAILAMEAEK